MIRFGKCKSINGARVRVTLVGYSGEASVDCLLLHQNPRLKPEELEAALPFKSVVADGSNTPFYIDRWRVFCTERGIPFSYTGDRNLGRGR